MEKRKIFTAMDYEGKVFFSEKSHEDIISSRTEYLMPGGFDIAYLSDKQINKLNQTDADGCPTHYLKNNRVYKIQ